MERKTEKEKVRDRKKLRKNRKRFFRKMKNLVLNNQQGTERSERQ